MKYLTQTYAHKFSKCFGTLMTTHEMVGNYSFLEKMYDQVFCIPFT